MPSSRFLAAALALTLLCSLAGLAAGSGAAGTTATPAPLAAAAAGAAPASRADTTRRVGSVMIVPGAPADTARAAKQDGGLSLDQRLAIADSLLKRRGGSHAEMAQLFLAWNAPWGTPGSSPVRMPACDDTAACDTLYMTFYAGRPSDGFNGVALELLFRATGSDTLGSWWHMDSASNENPGSLQVEWGPSRTMPGKQPWIRTGRGFMLSDRTPTALRLRLLYALPMDLSSPIDSNAVYTLARLILRHGNARRLTGCSQPICVEWTKASLAYALKDEPEVRRGERFVSYGGPLAICDPYRATSTQTWKPKIVR